MTKRTRGQRIWLEAPLDSHPIETPSSREQTPAVRRHGLHVTCEDEHQGTYRVYSGTGNEWLVARGADEIFEVIGTGHEQAPSALQTNRAINAVKAWIQKNRQ